jgi:excisionase family DNA binding protein
MNTQRANVHTSAQRLLYDRKEAARQLSISVRSLDYLIGQQKLSTRRLGKKVLIPHAELVRFASANHYEPMTPEERTDAA